MAHSLLVTAIAALSIGQPVFSARAEEPRIALPGTAFGSFTLPGSPLAIARAAQTTGKNVTVEPLRLVGDYFEGDGMGYNLHLVLKADGKFNATWNGCLGEYGRATGEWSVRKEGMKLLTRTCEGLLKDKPLNVLQIVSWRGHYLLVESGGASDGSCCLCTQAANKLLLEERQRAAEKLLERFRHSQ